MPTLLVPLRLALARLRAHAGRSALAAAGIAVGAAVLAMTAVAAVAVQDRAVQRALAGLGASDRAVQVNWSGVPGQSELSLAQLDRAARRSLGIVSARPPIRVAVFRQATWGGAYVNLGAADRLARWVALRSGRLPRPCTPARCELVQIGGAPVAPKLPFLHVVGRAVLRPGAPLAAYFGAAGPNRPPVLIANGVAGFVRVPLPDAAYVARTYGWIVPLAPGSVHAWAIPALRRRLDVAANRAESTTDLFSFAAPIDTLAAVEATSRVASRRLLLVGGDAAVLLLGFAVLASTRLRRDHRALRRRLRWLGARRGQAGLAAGAEIAAVTVLGTAIGWAAGAGAGALLARHLGSEGGAAVEHAVLTGGGFALACAIAVATALVMVVALRSDGVAVGGLTVTAADVAAAGALGAVLLALARGKADPASLGSGGTGVMLLVLPALVVLVLAALAARLLAPALRLLERAGRRGPAAVRVALLSLARAPGQVILSVVFFVVAVSVAVFALAYRGTLLAGETEQARYAVPADVVLQEDYQRLVTVQQAAPPAVASRLGRVVPVLRDSGYVDGNGGRDFTLLALPAGAFARIQGWRSDFSADTPGTLAGRLRPPQPMRLAGIDLPPGADRLELPVDVRGGQVTVTLTVLDPRGDFADVRFGDAGVGRRVLTGRVPPEARGGRVVALWLTFPTLAAFAADHKDTGNVSTTNDASAGRLVLGRLRVGARKLPAWPGWTGLHGVRRLADAGTGGIELRYLVNRAAGSVFRPREPLEGVPVPVVASPAVAAAAGPGGAIALHVDQNVVRAQVVGVSRYVPSVSGDAVVADLSWWFAAANAAEPGLAVPSELWVDRLRSGARRLLAQRPFSALDAVSQRQTAASLRSDPLARGTLDVLLVTAGVGLALAVIGVLLAVVGDLRDESGELFDLEAQGASPAEVRRHLLLRAGVVAAVGGAGGLGAGLVVGALAVSVVTVTAGAGSPLPPLARVEDWPLVGLALAAVCAAAGLAAFVATRGAYAAAGRRRFSEGLE